MSLDCKLENLVKRLEQTTARLETLSVSQKPGLAPKPTNASGNSLNVMSQDTPPSIVQFDDAVDEPLRAFTELSAKIGGDVDEVASKFKFVFGLHREFLWHAAGTKEPDQNALMAKLSPITNAIGEINSFKESKRNTPFFNHVSAVAEGTPAVFWVTVKKTPAPYVKDMLDASMFFVNRVRTEHKGKDLHSDWTKAWIELFNALQKYVKQVHTTGLVWNSSPGATPPSDISQGGPARAPAAGGPPPPPPPPPADLFADVKKGAPAAPSSADAGRQALFADLNKGEDVTKGLKKVTADMQTHKNPELRGQGPAPAKSPKPAGAGGSPAKLAVVDKPPKLELKDGKTWNVEYHKGNREIVIQISDMKQTVYVFRCENSVVQIKGKVNSVTMDNCKKTSVVFDSLLGQIEVINCQSVEVQTLGTLPTISIQKTDGCQVYLSKESVGAEIVTSKSSEMNVLVPKGDEGDFTEFPVPEQFKTTVNLKTNKLDTTVSDIA